MKPVFVGDHGGPGPSIFLAGPTTRSAEVPSWRPEALRLLTDFPGEVFIPEWSDGLWHRTPEEDYQIKWEHAHLQRARTILFWIPRVIETMPAFTTNVEFGLWLESGKVVYGRPSWAAKVNYLDWHARRTGLTIHETLESTIEDASRYAILG